MGLQKYRFDETGDTEPNGSVPLYSKWFGGPSLAGIRNCPCSDGVTRTVYITGEADTFFSMPACVAVKGKRRKGFITVQTVGDMDTGDKLGYRFTFNRDQESQADAAERYNGRANRAAINGDNSDAGTDGEESPA